MPSIRFERRRISVAGRVTVRWLALLLASPAAGLWGQTIVVNPLVQASSDQVVAATSPAGVESIATSVDADGNAVSVQGDTYRPIPDALQNLFRRGGVPSTLTELKQLERQQMLVSIAGGLCTVGVKIGPAQGCGVIVTRGGIVLTAAHVAMRPGKKAEILLSDGRVVTATTLGMFRGVDAGMMRIDAGQNNGQPWPCASPGRSKNLKPGMWCVATGHPGGFDIDRGNVTRVGRILTVREGSIVTDCALIGGDSGGPLFDLEGRLIAVHSRIGNDVADNLHVPIDHYSAAWDRLLAGNAWGFLPGFRPVIGVSGNSQLSQAIVQRVYSGSPADDAGLQPGDVILQFGDVPITDFQSLTRAVQDTMPGERVRLWIRRDQTDLRVSMEIGRDSDDE